MELTKLEVCLTFRIPKFVSAAQKEIPCAFIITGNAPCYEDHAEAMNTLYGQTTVTVTAGHTYNNYCVGER